MTTHYEKYRENCLKAQKKYDDANREKKHQYEKIRWQRQKENNRLVKEYKDRIDEAIEYCEDITSREIDISDTDYDLGQDFTARDILHILRGEDNESN